MDAYHAPGHQPDAAALATVQAAIAEPATNVWSLLSAPPASFIRPSNIVSLADFRARRRRRR